MCDGVRRWLVLAVVVCLSGMAAPAAAAEFYVDPVNGSDSGDGSAQHPWKSLQTVWDSGLIATRDWNELPYDDTRHLVAKNEGAPVGPGDTIWLRDGYYGHLEIMGAYNEAPITIAAAPDQTPRFASVRLVSVSGWVLRGLSVSPSYAPDYEQKTLVAVEDHGWHGPSSDVSVEDCHLFSVEDTSQWSGDDWVQKACNGVNASAADVTVRNNRLDNVHFGISMSGDRAHVVGNRVTNFSGDGMRGLGDDSVFEYNRVANCYDVDENHDDGFQSWSNGPDGVGSGEVRGMVLRGNTIINYENPNQPLRGTLQGIGCFDGMFVDWVVENNVIMVDHWHGITLMGAKNSRVVNNTVVDLNTERPGPPWISITPHKNGTPSEEVVVRNNLATALNLADGQPTVTADHNMVVEDLASYFVDPAGYDLHLLETAAAVDSGSSQLAPPVDIEQIARPQGDGVDLGAYEYHTAGVEPVDAGGSADAGAPDATQPDTGMGDTGQADAASGGADARDSGDQGGAGRANSAEGCGCRGVGAPVRTPWWVMIVAAMAVVAGPVWRGRRKRG